MTPTQHARNARKITRTLFAVQSLGSAGFIASATISALVGAELSGRASWAGVPSGVYQLGAAFAALLWGLSMDRLGRRGGIALGLFFGVLGALLAAGAVVAGSLIFLLVGLVMMGSAQAAVRLGRFAAAEVQLPQRRGRAVALVVLGGTVGSVLGPLLVGPSGRWANAFGANELAGPYAVGAMLFALAAVVIFLLLRPDPRDLGLELAKNYPEVGPVGQLRSINKLLREPGVMAAVGTMVFGQAVMVMMMVITSLYMRDNAHSLESISLVFAAHTFGMYAFSVFSGWLTDHWGRTPVILSGASALALASLIAPLSAQLLPLIVALFLLGLGWNFSFVGGSALLSDQLSPAEKSKTQGVNDLLIGLASAAGSIGSGVVFAALGYGVMGIIGAVVALIPFALVLWWQWTQRGLLNTDTV